MIRYLARLLRAVGAACLAHAERLEPPVPVTAPPTPCQLEHQLREVLHRALAPTTTQENRPS